MCGSKHHEGSREKGDVSTGVSQRSPGQTAQVTKGVRGASVASGTRPCTSPGELGLSRCRPPAFLLHGPGSGSAGKACPPASRHQPSCETFRNEETLFRANPR